MSLKSPQARKQLLVFILATALTALALYLFYHFEQTFHDYLDLRIAGRAPSDSLLKIVNLLLLAILAYLAVRALNSALFGVVFRFRRGYEAPILVRNIFSIIAFAALFFLVFSRIYPDVNLGALFTTSAIFGVIIGLALQDTLGNFFAGISLHADRPFQVGDVITVGQQKLTGVVEGVTWRAIKIRTFQNHIVLVANSNAAKEAIEVCPRDNLNARLVFFGTLYTDSPAKTIHVVREAVRDAENVSRKITPIVRIRNLGEYAIEWEIKYWLDDYAKYNDTDALVRQRIWYALRRTGLTFAFPTRTLHLQRKAALATVHGDARGAVDRLSAVDIFAPLSVEETERLAAASASHVFAPGEMVIRAGDQGSSMFVVHHGRVQVQVTEGGKPRVVAVLSEGDFFGEMALLTGEPRTASVVALGETEVLEIGHAAMKPLFDTNPDLAESISYTIAERRAVLATHQEVADPRIAEPAGLLASIKRFFGLH
jgi:small-conductance mechanosensitive channel/CRP-like cAMP-binding protein